MLRIISAPTTTRIVGRVNPSGACGWDEELALCMGTKSEGRCVNFEILISICLRRVTQELFRGAAAAIPVAGVLKLPDEIPACNDDSDIERVGC